MSIRLSCWRPITEKMTYRLSADHAAGTKAVFRPRKRARLHRFQRPHPIPGHAILTDGGKHHPSSVGRDGHRAAVEELHGLGFGDREADGLDSRRLRSPRRPDA